MRPVTPPFLQLAASKASDACCKFMSITLGTVDISPYPLIPYSVFWVRGDKHSQLHMALIWPTTLVLSCAGTNPEKPNPYSSLSVTRTSQSKVLKKLKTSPTVTVVLAAGRFEVASAVPPLAVVPGEAKVPVSQEPRIGSVFPYFRDGK